MFTVINTKTNTTSQMTKSQLQNLVRDFDEDFYTSIFISHTEDPEGDALIIMGGDDT